MGSKLWDKNYTLNSLMEEFTVSNDYIIDHSLVLSDVISSIAQAKGLRKIGILSSQEEKELISALSDIASLKKRGEFEINRGDEDVHTAIENFLTERLGDAGKKIHTGRSRNDQSLTALRVYMREAIVKISSYTSSLIESLISLAEENKETPMPGRTHMQIAMPSSVALWALSFSEELIDEVRELESLYSIIDQSPLGSAASYGTTLNTDREYLSSLLGFSKVQNNVLYANNSRGKFEAMLLDRLTYIVLTISKLAEDLLIFTLPELGYFSLPKEMTTGSSIMPQKKNPDGLELIRSRSSLILSLSFEVKEIIKALPTGYNRDFQDTKEPLIKGIKESVLIIRIMNEMVSSLIVNKERLIEGCTPELYATDRAMEMAAAGKPFRDSYKEVALSLDSVEKDDPVESLKKRKVTGSAGCLNLDKSKSGLDEIRLWSDEKMSYLEGIYRSLDKEIDEVALI